jgi:hypothetical protein
MREGWDFLESNKQPRVKGKGEMSNREPFVNVTLKSGLVSALTPKKDCKGWKVVVNEKKEVNIKNGAQKKCFFLTYSCISVKSL